MMGVHDLSVYPQVKELLGIPADEPIFILRAQDITYQPMLAVYEQLYLASVRTQREKVDGKVKTAARTAEPQLMNDHWAFADHINACRENGRRWQRRNSEKVKVPD